MPTGLLTSWATPATEPSERGELLRLDQRGLGLAQVSQRGLGGFLGFAHLLLAALALADVERHGDDPLDLAVGIEQRQLVDQPLPHVAGGILVLLLVEAETFSKLEHPLVVLVGLGCAVARHQIRGGAAERIGGLDAEDAGHVAVHQHVAQLAVLDVDDRGHGVDDLLEQAPSFGDGVFRPLLVGDVAQRALVADDVARLVPHARGAVGEPQDVAAALAHLVLELAHDAVARHQPLIFGARLGVDVDGVGDVVDAVDELLRAVIAHHPRQRRIGVEEIAGRRRRRRCRRPSPRTVCGSSLRRGAAR